jgi:hypothetical protein
VVARHNTACAAIGSSGRIASDWRPPASPLLGRAETAVSAGDNIPGNPKLDLHDESQNPNLRLHKSCQPRAGVLGTRRAAPTNRLRKQRATNRTARIRAESKHYELLPSERFVRYVVFRDP